MKTCERGFSLMEIMVVVAMVGILSAIGFSGYQKFVSHSRTQEAKVNLAAVYVAERNFYVANFSYTLCLENIGYSPGYSDPYYYLGFMNSGGFTCGPGGTQSCSLYDFGITPPLLAPCSCGIVATDGNNIQHTGCFWLPKVDIDPGTPLNLGFIWPALRTTFTAGAQGKITAGLLDVWTIDDKKFLSRVQVGE